MRFHRNLIEGVVQVLHAIFNEGAYADRALESTLKRNRQWGSRDRGFVAETVYEIVRHRRLFAEIAGAHPPFTQQAIYRLFGVWSILRGYPLPDWSELQGLSESKVQERHAALSGIRKFRESVPDWLDALGAESLGEEIWDQELTALNQQAPVVLRTNRLCTSREALKKALFAEGFETTEVPGSPDALVLDQRGNVFRTKAFREGMFEVQDASSQKVAPFLEVHPGMRVVDACSGAGGKTLHLAALMENKGQLLALDIYQGKLSELRKRAKRAGAFNIETRLIDSSKVIKRLKGKADRVLIDAPCTGLGVLRRNPDAKWKLQPEFLDRVTATQRELLEKYSQMVREGGLLVYATCSVLPMENEQQIAAFLQSEAGKDFEMVREDTLLASRDGFDGFYMARLRRA
jgi:16S rRNA (cytosine967-C5)-methyltransferase